MTLRFLPLAAALLAVGAPAKAQSNAPATATADKARLNALTPGQRQAASELLGSIYTAESFMKIIDQMLAAQLQQRPELKAYEPEMRAFFSKYMSFETIRPDLAEAYAQKFSESELREVTKFYQSATGRKFASMMPQMMQAGMEIGQRRVTEHIPELQEAIQKKMEAK
ncbi:DUF2059 domain-containing protein [Hymenobacter convexus]|uniref:DUF2059 domain-containing protein n=1 Tax=Hymenobacter sp. CA1UV-4 TaxID=3063782 RepID=UPI002712DE70|nr:DUF2059 domain-containing protein [Hymenobacter sp. CA1UV-4]MDO7854332.1 DUF2059 domain-containing protein [Hymenobacter sp. CA1UV-4]